MSGSGSFEPVADPGQRLGLVIACRGSEARIGLTGVDGGLRATVGRLVGIRSGDGLAVGMIAEIRVADASLGIDGVRAVARVDLMGEIVSSGGLSRFQRGVREYPAIGDAAEIVGRDDLRLIYASAGGRSINLGQLHQDALIAARADADNLVSKHFAVLGSTGVGKSSGLTVIINGLVKARPDIRVLVLDVHNEYGRSFGRDASVIGAHNLKLPFWLFNFEEMIDVIYGGKPAVMEEVEILAELIPHAKSAYAGYKNRPDRAGLVRRPAARQSAFSADTPAPYLIQDLLALIDERMGKLENRATRMFHHRLMMRIEAIKNDPRYAFMFENANVGGDTMAAVLDQLFHLESEDAGITILKLASLPGEVVDAVVCVVSRLAFEFGLWSDGGIPLLLVCEEAHRFAAADHEVGFAPARRAVARIAKEGRKYSVHLGLVTQRPAELDPTIISQCSTLFVMRMANDQDQSLLRSAVSDSAANLLNFVPSLATGEVIGVGEGMPMPARFMFKTLPRDVLPASESDMRADDEPAGGSRGDIVRRAIERWRRATTNQSPQSEEGAPPLDPEGALGEGGSAVARGLSALGVERLAPAGRPLHEPQSGPLFRR